MKIVYVLPHAGRCGGVRVIGEHVSRLNALGRGYDAQVWGLTGSFTGWFPRPVPHRLFPHTDQLGAALQQFQGVKVATFWITASWVINNLLPGEQGYYLVQDEDQLTYSGDASGSSYKLGLKLITEGEFVTEEIQRKHGVPCHNVGIGYDEDVFRPLPMIRERFRVLTPYRPHAGGNDLKGWGLALDVWKRIHAVLPDVASLVTFGDSSKPRGVPGSHIHVSGASDVKLRELYSQSGVFLHTAKHEGFGLPMLEAMACGCPVVCTDSHGNREFCRDLETALVSNSAEALADYCLRIMKSDEMFDYFSKKGIQEAEGYRWDTVIRNLCSVFMI